jgi:sugar lactone lactonase YvrE
MVRDARNTGALVLRLLVVIALLGCPRVGSAEGMWSVISLPQQPGKVVFHGALTVDSAGNLYVADVVNSQLQKRDALGNWSVIATWGTSPGQVIAPRALATDTAGNLYLADYGTPAGRVQKRDTQGRWSVIASAGTALGQVINPTALAVDTAGNLYVASGSEIQKRDTQGNWSVIATYGAALGQVSDYTSGLAVDTAGNLYVADAPTDRTEPDHPRIQKRDAQGNWSVIATGGSAIGQVSYPSRLAVDTAGNLYVADTNNNRVQKYTPGP